MQRARRKVRIVSKYATSLDIDVIGLLRDLLYFYPAAIIIAICRVVMKGAN